MPDPTVHSNAVPTTHQPHGLFLVMQAQFLQAYRGAEVVLRPFVAGSQPRDAG